MLHARELADGSDLTNGEKACIFNPTEFAVSTGFSRDITRHFCKQQTAVAPPLCRPQRSLSRNGIFRRLSERLISSTRSHIFLSASRSTDSRLRRIGVRCLSEATRD